MMMLAEQNLSAAEAAVISVDTKENDDIWSIQLPKKGIISDRCRAAREAISKTAHYFKNVDTEKIARNDFAKHTVAPLGLYFQHKDEDEEYDAYEVSTDTVDFYYPQSPCNRGKMKMAPQPNTLNPKSGMGRACDLFQAHQHLAPMIVDEQKLYLTLASFGQCQDKEECARFLRQVLASCDQSCFASLDLTGSNNTDGKGDDDIWFYSAFGIHLYKQLAFSALQAFLREYTLASAVSARKEICGFWKRPEVNTPEFDSEEYVKYEEARAKAHALLAARLSELTAASISVHSNRLRAMLSAATDEEEKECIQKMTNKREQEVRSWSESDSDSVPLLHTQLHWHLPKLISTDGADSWLDLYGRPLTTHQLATNTYEFCSKAKYNTWYNSEYVCDDEIESKRKDCDVNAKAFPLRVEIEDEDSGEKETLIYVDTPPLSLRSVIHDEIAQDKYRWVIPSEWQNGGKLFEDGDEDDDPANWTLDEAEMAFCHAFFYTPRSFLTGSERPMEFRLDVASQEEVKDMANIVIWTPIVPETPLTEPEVKFYESFHSTQLRSWLDGEKPLDHSISGYAAWQGGEGEEDLPLDIIAKDTLLPCQLAVEAARQGRKAPLSDKGVAARVHRMNKKFSASLQFDRFTSEVLKISTVESRRKRIAQCRAEMEAHQRAKVKEGSAFTVFLHVSPQLLVLQGGKDPSSTSSSVKSYEGAEEDLGDSPRTGITSDDDNNTMNMTSSSFSFKNDAAKALKDRWYRTRSRDHSAARLRRAETKKRTAIAVEKLLAARRVRAAKATAKSQLIGATKRQRWKDREALQRTEATVRSTLRQWRRFTAMRARARTIYSQSRYSALQRQFPAYDDGWHFQRDEATYCEVMGGFLDDEEVEEGKEKARQARVASSQRTADKLAKMRARAQHLSKMKKVACLTRRKMLDERAASKLQEGEKQREDTLLVKVKHAALRGLIGTVNRLNQQQCHSPFPSPFCMQSPQQPQAEISPVKASAKFYY